MHDIEIQEMSDGFFPAWHAAGIHLNKQVDGGIRSWLRAHPYPPFLEHLSFRLGNQLFLVRIEDARAKVEGPGSLRGLLMAANSAGGHACVLPMTRSWLTGKWSAEQPGWGLLDAKTYKPVNPPSWVSEEKIEMSPWEVHDMSVQVVREYLQKQGFKLMSWQGNPEVDPSIWFVGKSGGPEWVVVRSARYPVSVADRPNNWSDIARSCARLSATGHFASVALVSVDQPFGQGDEKTVPLWRGHGTHVRFTGLV